MTAVTARVNLNDVQETKTLVSLMGNNEKQKFPQVDNEKASDVYAQVKTIFQRSLDLLAMKKDFFSGLIVASIAMLLINSSAVLYLDVSRLIQFIDWNISFGKNCKSTTQMESSAFVYRWIFLITMFSIPICITGIHSSIKILSKIGWSYILFFLLGSVQFCAILSLFISLLTDEQIFKGTMSEEEYALSKISSSLFCFKFVCILSSVQHIGLVVVILLTKPKNFDIFLNNNQCSPSLSEVVIPTQEQMISQEKQEENIIEQEKEQIDQEKQGEQMISQVNEEEEEINNICGDYVIC